ncbi:MAG: response regulator transcription factor [Gemmatimonadetes bacterium]|jgi:two-component system, LytTR family, response regulator|nr:response regulator transcription factor [Gemmatimonadota bacterium]
MKYRTLLVDDEPLALQRMRRLLEAHAATIEIIGDAEDGATAIEKINRLRPDLIFLDIQMPGFSGFEVVEKLVYPPWIIFCTAYDTYALEAFETHAIDYLVKPVAPQRLQKTIEKIQRLTAEEKGGFQDQLQSLMSAMQKTGPRRIQIRLGDRIRFLNVSDIFFFCAADKYVEACTYDQSYLLSQSLNQLESELPADDFVRIHRSALVNLNHVDEIIRWFGGTFRVRMSDKKKTELPVSRGSKSKLGL